ncbi:MAG: hypothetical protein LBE37_20065 [Sphingobacterium sp.]|jgi:hypothetical protein|uniref:DUF7674 domain-containing protein n=1 Tax=Sphingobacterium tabacisoli TaxID=2044855 RepID=A0ABW5L7P3_9SPHI|nr:hypothetical protein [Sphingobacterium tabacisoli]MDR2285519.1 hypothetical protein [Sphingobacterium sp.]
MKKVNEENIADYLADDCKEIEEQIVQLSRKRNIAGVLQAVVNFLRTLLHGNRLSDVSAHLQFLARLHRSGNRYVRYLIENLVVRSFEGLKRQCGQGQWDILYAGIPRRLQHVYQRQTAENLIQKSKL